MTNAGIGLTVKRTLTDRPQIDHFHFALCLRVDIRLRHDQNVRRLREGKG